MGDAVAVDVIEVDIARPDLAGLNSQFLVSLGAGEVVSGGLVRVSHEGHRQEYECRQ